MSTLAVRSRPRNLKPRPFGQGILPPEPELNDLDRAWNFGFFLGHTGVGGLAPADWHDLLKDAFYDGLGEGERKRDEEMAAALEAELVILSARNAAGNAAGGSAEGGAW